MSDASLLVEIKQLLEHVLTRLGGDLPPSIESDFGDIDPAKLYEIAELVKLRGGTRQAYYKALNAKRLRETLTAGRRKVKGADFIAYLQSKRKR